MTMFTWKWFYRVPNTYKELKLAKMRTERIPISEGVNPADSVTFKNFFSSKGTGCYSFWEFFSVAFGPYLQRTSFSRPVLWQRRPLYERRQEYFPRRNSDKHSWIRRCRHKSRRKLHVELRGCMQTLLRIFLPTSDNCQP